MMIGNQSVQQIDGVGPVAVDESPEKQISPEGEAADGAGLDPYEMLNYNIGGAKDPNYGLPEDTNDAE